MTHQQLLHQQSQCVHAIQQYGTLIAYFKNAGQLSPEQQTYLQNLLQNQQIQQQQLQRVQLAQYMLNQQNQAKQQQDAQQAEKDQQIQNISTLIENHKAIQVQLMSSQQILQNQSVQIAQQLQLHTLQYSQSQQQGNSNAMYVLAVYVEILY